MSTLFDTSYDKNVNTLNFVTALHNNVDSDFQRNAIHTTLCCLIMHHSHSKWTMTLVQRL